MQVHVDKDEKELSHSTKKRNVMDPSKSAQAQQMETIPLTKGDTSKMKGSAQQVYQCTKVAFPDESKSQVDITSSMGKDDKLKTIMEMVEVDIEDSYENRVQGLSGNNMLESDDDLLSGDIQAGSTGHKVSRGSLNLGLVRCSVIVLHQSEKEDVNHPEGVKRQETVGGEKLDVKPQVFMITDKQRLLETRCSARIEQQWLGKIQEKQKASNRKRPLEGTKLSSKKSFEILDNDGIASIGLDMGISISADRLILLI
jgi:hypothetical protein